MHWLHLLHWLYSHHPSVLGVWRPGGVSVNPPPISGPAPIPHGW